MAKRKPFAPFSPELLLASLGAAVAGLWIAKRLLARGQPATVTTYDAQGRPIPPIPPID